MENHHPERNDLSPEEDNAQHQNGIAATNGNGINAAAKSQSSDEAPPSYHMPEPYAGNIPPTANGVFVHSNQDPEAVIEISPNGRYAKLNTVLGKGAYKVVYKAIDRDEGYEVAWNCFQTSRAEYSDLNEETKILKQVRHPNIINFHEYWHKDTEFVFVTELMTSGTLREYIRKLSLPNTKIVKRWSRQILKGLIYLHAHDPPIIHRDIKCDNIFINGAHGEVKIGDMGTAKMKLGKKYTVIGTPEFMAPEMYEEGGYNEKVDIYAFGMCLLEMVTGEYPYSECQNAAQIYKKVTQGIKPESLSKVQDGVILDLINHCLAPENERYTAQQIMDHPFLTEPEVVLLDADERKINLKLQVVFKEMDKLSVKFDFNVEKDTAEEVVNEMIHEKVLPTKYEKLITHEINRILRDLSKPSQDDKTEESRSPWPVPSSTTPPFTVSQPFVFNRDSANETTSSSVPVPHESFRKSSSQNDWPAELDDVLPVKEYSNDTDIETFVHDTAVATNRDPDRAKEWTAKLKNQDLLTVGDLRGLLDEDWAGIGLTVFALRALKNALHGKSLRSPIINPRSSVSANTSGEEGP